MIKLPEAAAAPDRVEPKANVPVRNAGVCAVFPSSKRCGIPHCTYGRSQPVWAGNIATEPKGVLDELRLGLAMRSRLFARLEEMSG